MIDYVFIGSSPSGEPCAQVGSENYHMKAQLELRAFINQLRRAFGVEPSGALLKVKKQQHDFGEYAEVVCYYNDTLQESVDYAMRCESECPEYWDEEAKKELKGEN